MEEYYQVNRAVGWCSVAVGAIVGLVLGLWSFDGPLRVPAWLGEYDHTERRMVRLGHIAFFGLGFLNLMLARELPRSGLSHRARSWASGLMVVGNIGLPLALFAGVLWMPLKYSMSLPATAVALALMLAAYGSMRGRR